MLPTNETNCRSHREILNTRAPCRLDGKIPTTQIALVPPKSIFDLVRRFELLQQDLVPHRRVGPNPRMPSRVLGKNAQTKYHLTFELIEARPIATVRAPSNSVLAVGMLPIY